MLNKIKFQDILKYVKTKNVFLRADFNVPIKEGKITSNRRILETLPTITKILENSPKGIILASHLGRPDGKPNREYSLLPVKDELEKLLNRKVKFVSDCVGEEAKVLSSELKEGEILLLENLRFYGEEEGSFINDKNEKTKVDQEKVKQFRQKLSSYANYYVNDAFGTSHRAHSSIVGINAIIKAPGLLMEKEITYFGQLLEKSDQSLTVILGGAKVSDKLPLIKNLLNKCDQIIIGGGMAFTFLAQKDKMAIGGSIFDTEGAKMVADIYEEASRKGVSIHLPVDFICSKDIKNPVDAKIVSKSDGIEKDWKGFDIGPKSIENFQKVIKNSKTIFMNGPMGVFEVNAFAKGSIEIVKSLVDATQNYKTITVVGGGDTVSMISKVKGADQILSHVSTGGGASLELLEGKKLPGVEYLSNKKDADQFR